MTDAERINQLEKELRDVKAKLADLTLALGELSNRAGRWREGTKTAVDGIQVSLDAIFTNVKVPNVRHTPGVRYTID